MGFEMPLNKETKQSQTNREELPSKHQWNFGFETSKCERAFSLI